MFINNRSIYFFLIFAALAVQSFAQTTGARERNFDAEHYVIRTSFNRAEKTAYGDTTIVLKPLADNFKTFTLDAANLKIESIRLENSDKPLSYRIAGDQLNITLDKDYSAANSIAVRIRYSSIHPRGNKDRGLFFIDPVRKNSRELRSAQIWTQGEPEDNRYWFPSYDFPDDKATSEQFITVNADETAIGNGKLIEVKTNADKTKTFHYRMDVPHSTYLVSLVVGKYAKISDEYNKIPLNFFVYPGTERAIEPAFGKTKKMFRLFENLTGVPYPFAKYDQTIVAGFTDYAGMENITATTLADTEILKALENPSVEIENLVSHELAHSWFGNLVTCKNWSELWLNEGFATFMESAFLESEYGRQAYLSEMQNNAEAFFVQEDKARLRHPLLNLRARPDPLLFDATTYKKGGFVVHMLREIVGDAAFWKSVNAYLNAHKFGNAETPDLQTAFEKTSGKDLNWFFDQWIRKSGYPAIKIEPVYNAANRELRLTIKQTQKPDSQTPAVFRLFAEIEIQTVAGNKIEKIEINEREQNFNFAVSEKPVSIAFDPRNQILDKTQIEEIR